MPPQFDAAHRPGRGRRWRGAVAGLAIVGVALGAGSLAGVISHPPPVVHTTKRQHSFSAGPSISATPAAQSLAQVAANDLPEIVTIVAIGRQTEELGTGWPIDSQGDFITNDHVVRDGLSFHALTAAGAEYPAQVINVDAALDLAEVRVVGLREQPFTLGELPAAIGEPVVVLASEGATGKPPVTDSVINGVGERATVEHAEPGQLSNYSDMIRIPARIFPGNSGGPMLTAGGQVVGILTLAAANGSGAFAIPLAEVDPIIQQWLQT
ncbi:MAG: S1C family serine protease [Candidatus Dormibacteria bacterium]